MRGGGRSFERMGRHHGSILKVSKDGSKLTRYATDCVRQMVGVGPDGQVTMVIMKVLCARSPIN